MKRLHHCADINPIAINSLGTSLEDWDEREFSWEVIVPPQRQDCLRKNAAGGYIRMILRLAHVLLNISRNPCSTVRKFDMLYNTQYLEVFTDQPAPLERPLLGIAGPATARATWPFRRGGRDSEQSVD